MARHLAVIGHRGARGLFPENTLEGFRAAAAIGVTDFELDVGMTADGAVVVCHDHALNPDLARDDTGSWIDPPGPLIWSMSRQTLVTYDVGRLRPESHTSRLFREQTPIDGAQVPLLADVLAALPRAGFVIEVKTDPTRPERTASPALLANAVLGVVDQTGSAHRVVIESFDWRVQRHIRAVRPDIRLAWLTSPATEAMAGVWWGATFSPAPGLAPGPVQGPIQEQAVPVCVAAASSGDPARGRRGDTWAPEFASLTEKLVRRAQALGLSVLPWTVNRLDDMRQLIDWQVDGVITDRPDLLLPLADPTG